MDNIVEKLIGVNKDYITINPVDFKKGHGGGLSVKIVLPCHCQANCVFCFNKFTKDTQKHDYEQFLTNLPKTLDMIFDNINNRPISLDITGNEPTFNIEFLSSFLNIIKQYKIKTEKIVLTTNGYNLDKCLSDLVGVVDIVNISIHHFDYLKRQDIFKTSHIPSDASLENIIKFLKDNGITCTAVSVLYDKIDNFFEFHDNLVAWATKLGFKDIRIRSNFCSDDKYINDILNTKMKNEIIVDHPALTMKIITDEDTGFKTYILRGVPDLTEYIIGPELVIDDNGYCYIDYNKRYPVNNSNISYFSNIYTFVNLNK